MLKLQILFEGKEDLGIFNEILTSAKQYNIKLNLKVKFPNSRLYEHE